MKELIRWAIVIGVGTLIVTPLMIATVESRPVSEWAGIAYFLLCLVVPVIVALLVTAIAMYAHLQWRLAQLKGHDR